uniref:Histone-like protein n=1 Tax=Marseillevirus LCMAC201 TaxID=2506605 RepID=A0A481YWL5_9VIRU|nr:MAG: histone-like protein [Marseillevirus LCMAC201]
MSFNKNASKRLSIIAGIKRGSHGVTDIIKDVARDYLTKILRSTINIVLFSGRKTLLVEDLRFLSRICLESPQVACPTNLVKLAKVCIKPKDIEAVLYGYRGYSLYTLKKPFNKLVRDIIHELYREEIRIGKNVTLLLQNMTEHHIIKVMNHAATYSNRNTLLAKDIETLGNIF